MSTSVRWAAGTTALMLCCGVVQGEIPKRSEPQLNRTASHVFVGTVVETYERQRKTGNRFEHTYGIAEIRVKAVEKGTDLALGNRVFVRYWRKRWIGDGPPPTGHSGHWNIPAAGNTVRVFVRGNPKSGFDVLSPNGFFSVKKGVITRTRVSDFVLGKSTQDEILGRSIGAARLRREQFAAQGLYFEFHQGKELTGITVSSSEYQLENGLRVGSTEADVRKLLGEPDRTAIVTEKLRLDNVLVYQDFVFLLDDAKKVASIRIGSQ